MSESVPTTERLALALEKAGAPASMIASARRGRYDDYKSESASPIIDLVCDLRSAGLVDLATRAMNGEFDGTKEEGDAWFQREGKGLLS